LLRTVVTRVVKPALRSVTKSAVNSASARRVRRERSADNYAEKLRRSVRLRRLSVTLVPLRES